MCKCENVQMCKWSPLLAEFMNYINCSYSITQQVKATICTFAHSHICTLIRYSLFPFALEEVLNDVHFHERGALFLAL